MSLVFLFGISLYYLLLLFEVAMFFFVIYIWYMRSVFESNIFLLVFENVTWVYYLSLIHYFAYEFDIKVCYLSMVFVLYICCWYL